MTQGRPAEQVASGSEMSQWRSVFTASVGFGISVGAAIFVITTLVAAIATGGHWAAVFLGVGVGVVCALGMGVTMLLALAVIRRIAGPSKASMAAFADDIPGSFRAFARWYRTGINEAAGRASSPAAWAAGSIAVFVMTAGLIATANAALATIQHWPDMSISLASTATDWQETLQRATFMAAALFIGLTVWGLLAVPQRGTVRERTVATFTYLVLSTAWFATLYQAGSAARLLEFSVEGSPIGPGPNIVDAIYLALGTVITAGGSGIAPATSFTRFVVTMQFAVVAALVYWLLRDRAT